jgi:hypothetical protein
MALTELDHHSIRSGQQLCQHNRRVVPRARRQHDPGLNQRWSADRHAVGRVDLGHE